MNRPVDGTIGNVSQLADGSVRSDAGRAAAGARE